MLVLAVFIRVFSKGAFMAFSHGVFDEFCQLTGTYCLFNWDFFFVVVFFFAASGNDLRVLFVLFH